ncbi:hypothetical protein COT64_02435 [Candidatus Shapirobacteria bacterium CG09_land_8_20_14_0_10_39_12]|uniref:Uncharacterized protein n=1 Tax=Candidatus Shapirobacteria bacterium CG09_land_8_20_14_0_10_39_12 TaxID=1974885 RepID=A0A2H0WPD3_9BACT|nr:MAG: hypothetical protein COT64_02435 [Candidatus Shapirobacteria bacterium CG09_land_8_20_14_0_10_39_12]
MLPIERFNRRLQRTQALLEEQLGGEDPYRTAKALSDLERVKKTLSWLPCPSSLATGTAGQASLAMSHGTRR